MRVNLTDPKTSFLIKSGAGQTEISDQKVLIIAEAEGTSSPKEIVKNPLLSKVNTLLGTTSMATVAYKRFREINRYTQVDIMPLENPQGGSPPKSIITLSGTATESKDLFLRIADDSFKVKIPISNGDVDTVVATKIAEAVNEAKLPFSSNVEANNKEVGISFLINGVVNHDLVVLNSEIEGLTIMSAVFSGGDGSFDTDDIFENVFDRYQTIVFDASIQLETVVQFLEARFNVENEVLSGIGVTVLQGDESELSEKADSLNSKVLVAFANLDEMKTNAIPLLLATEFTAKRTLRLTDDAYLGNLVINPEESYGGLEKASLPYHNTPMSYLATTNRVSLITVENLMKKGLSFLANQKDHSVLKSIVTTYKTDPSGQEDLTFKYLNYVDQAMIIQEYYFKSSKSRFAQTRATQGDLKSGRAITNALSVKGYLKEWYLDLARATIVQDGKAAMAWFERNLSVKLNSIGGVYSVSIRVPLTSQFREMKGIIFINFDINK